MVEGSGIDSPLMLIMGEAFGKIGYSEPLIVFLLSFGATIIGLKDTEGSEIVNVILSLVLNCRLRDEKSKFKYA